MIDPTVRRCAGSDTDLAQLAALESEARAAVTEQRGGARWLLEHPAIEPHWNDRCSKSDVWLAHIDDVVVGFLVADLVADPADELVVHIDQVWVTPMARELGFGDGLLEAAIGSARERGAVAVEGEALPGDRHTKNLYERAGIVARLITTYRAF
jgi:ribosomal protein S18 acetylase RimI-like enzyme